MKIPLSEMIPNHGRKEVKPLFEPTRVFPCLLLGVQGRGQGNGHEASRIPPAPGVRNDMGCVRGHLRCGKWNHHNLSAKSSGQQVAEVHRYQLGQRHYLCPKGDTKYDRRRV